MLSILSLLCDVLLAPSLKGIVLSYCIVFLGRLGFTSFTYSPVVVYGMDTVSAVREGSIEDDVACSLQ